MGRGKVEMRKIEDKHSRQVTFCKRRNGLIKKAHELSILCDAEVAVIAFSDRGRLYEFSSNNSLKSTIERHKKASSDTLSMTAAEINAQYYQKESSKLRNQIQTLQNTNRHLLGHSLNDLSIKELKALENRLERGLSRVRAMKNEILVTDIEYFLKKAVGLEKENALLTKKIAEVEAERYQKLSVLIGQELNALQAYAASNMVRQPSNLEEATAAYPLPH